MRLRLPTADRARNRGRPVADLRLAIDCLPAAAREAMLAGVCDPRATIIAGAYTDGEGICPMLAAHRRGGRTDLLAFARAWDRYTGVGRAPRRATARELRVLIAHLEASLLEDAAPDLAGAIAAHRRSVELRQWRARRETRRADRDRARPRRPPFKPLDPSDKICASRGAPRWRSLANPSSSSKKALRSARVLAVR
jgi:hypothetical protein